MGEYYGKLYITVIGIYHCILRLVTVHTLAFAQREKRRVGDHQ